MVSITTPRFQMEGVFMRWGSWTEMGVRRDAVISWTNSSDAAPVALAPTAAGDILRTQFFAVSSNGIVVVSGYVFRPGMAERPILLTSTGVLVDAPDGAFRWKPLAVLNDGQVLLGFGNVGNFGVYDELRLYDSHLSTYKVVGDPSLFSEINEPTVSEDGRVIAFEARVRPDVPLSPAEQLERGLIAGKSGLFATLMTNQGPRLIRVYGMPNDTYLDPGETWVTVSLPGQPPITADSHVLAFSSPVSGDLHVEVASQIDETGVGTFTAAFTQGHTSPRTGLSIYGAVLYRCFHRFGFGWNPPPDGERSAADCVRPDRTGAGNVACRRWNETS